MAGQAVAFRRESVDSCRFPQSLPHHGQLGFAIGLSPTQSCNSTVCCPTMPTKINAKLMSFDVFGTLISVRDGSYAAFRSILADANGSHVDVKAFWEIGRAHV